MFDRAYKTNSRGAQAGLTRRWLGPLGLCLALVAGSTALAESSTEQGHGSAEEHGFADERGPAEEIDGTADPFPWHYLRQVEWKEVATNDGSLYGFDYKLVVDESILALEGSRLKMEGYLTPLTDGDEHSKFLFTMNPHSGCSHCSEMSLTNTLLATSRRPLKFVDTKVTIEGVLKVVPEDKQGVLYRMSDMVVLKEHSEPGTASDKDERSHDGHDHSH